MTSHGYQGRRRYEEEGIIIINNNFVVVLMRRDGVLQLLLFVVFLVWLCGKSGMDAREGARRSGGPSPPLRRSTTPGILPLF